MLTFMLTCVKCTSYVTSWGVWGVSHAHATSRLGLGVGCVNVHVILRHMHMLRHVLGWVGCVNVHVDLRHMHMLRHVLGWVGWGVC